MPEELSANIKELTEKKEETKGDEVETTEGHISFIDHDVKDEDFPEEGTIGSLFDEE